MSKPRIAILFGAGASFDAWNGACPRSEQHRPPLACGLFKGFSNTASLNWKIAQSLPGVKALGSSLVPKAEQGTLNLEKELSLLSRHHDPRIREWFLDIPVYVREVMLRVSQLYMQHGGEGSYHALIRTVFSDVPHDVLFLTLNYDTLLERALASYGFAFGQIGDYLPRNGCQLLKLHGCVTWFRVVSSTSDSTAHSWKQSITKADLTKTATRLVMNPGSGVTSTDPPCVFYALPVDGPVMNLYPQLTLPLAGKDPSHLVCPTDHSVAAETFLRECPKLMVIGMSGLDSHVVRWLAKTMVDLRSIAFAMPDTEDTIMRFQSCFAEESRTLDRLKIDKWGRGFSEYAVSDSMESFMRSS